MTNPAHTGASGQSHGEWLRAQRQARGWSVPEMRRHLRDAARESGDTLPGNECLGVMIRRWEKNDGGVSERYRMHYCRAFGIPFHGFGTVPPPTLAGLIDSVAAQPTATEVLSRPLEEDELAELERLRGQYANLAIKHDKLRRGLVAWVYKVMHEDKNWFDPQPPGIYTPENPDDTNPN